MCMRIPIVNQTLYEAHMEQQYLRKMLNHFREGLAMLSQSELIEDKIFCSQLMMFIEYKEEDEEDLLFELEEERVSVRYGHS